MDGHQDLPSDGHEVAAVTITAGDRIRWSSRREICSDRRIFYGPRCPSSVPELYADLPFMYLFELVADDLCGTVTSLRRRRRWRALPCWDPRGGLARAPRAACMSGSGGRSHGCGPPMRQGPSGLASSGVLPAGGWWRCRLALSRRGVRWPGRRGSWAVSVVRTTASDPNRGMSVAAGGRVRPVGDHGQAFERR